MAEVKITISGKEYGFKFTNLTIVKYCELRGIEFHQFDKDMSTNITASNNAMFRAAIDVFSKGQSKLTEYEADDLIEQMSQEDYTSVMRAYGEGMRNIVTRLTSASESISKKK
jgi:hypothetical protein